MEYSGGVSSNLIINETGGGASPDNSCACLQVPNLVYHQHIEHWEHLDFIWGLDAPEQMFPAVLKLLQKYR